MRIPVAILLFLCFHVASAQSGTARAGLLTRCSAISLGPNGSLNGFVPSPGDAWHQDVSKWPLDPGSSKTINTPGDLGGGHLHPDFSSLAGGSYGIPYNVVDSSQTTALPIAITMYPDESDLTVVPVPPNPAVESFPAECSAIKGDRHLIVLDRTRCVAYEFWQASHCNGVWSASTTALWDLSKTEQRPFGLTSVDAAGLSIFEGLVRYDEILAGSIQHAIRFTARNTKTDPNHGYFTPPATHAAGTDAATGNIMGMRIRLKADYNVSRFSGTNQIILKAMKQYGLILADNGSNMFFQGTPDARWNDHDLKALNAVPSSAFEVVQMSPIYDSATAPKGRAPTILRFAASKNFVDPGTAIFLTVKVRDASYNYIDHAGFLRGDTISVTPAATTTYTLTSRNAFGTSTSTTSVTVRPRLRSTIKR